MPAALPDFPTGLGRRLGRGEASFTTRPRAAMTIKRRMADSAGQSTRRTALWSELRKQRNRDAAGQLQHGEKARNDLPERFAVAFDGQVPVQGVSNFGLQNITGTQMA